MLALHWALQGFCGWRLPSGQVHLDFAHDACPQHFIPHPYRTTAFRLDDEVLTEPLLPPWSLLQVSALTKDQTSSSRSAQGLLTLTLT